MQRRVTFHIGLEKTGTDSFQRFCTERRDWLRQAGTLYPVANLAFAQHSHEPLVACYLSYRDRSIRSSAQPREVVLRSLKADVERTDCGNVLISAEHFSSRFRDAEIAQLAADFAEFDCRIAVVLREHRARLCSAYSQAVLSGRAMTLDAYCDEVFHPDNPYMRCAETIGAWQRVFGGENIVVRRHQRGEDMIPVLCRALVADDFPTSSGRTYWDNPSLGPQATEWLRRINAWVGSGSSSLFAWLVLRKVRRGIARMLALLEGTHGRHQWQLSARNQARLDDIVATDDRWLEQHYGIRLGSTDAPPVQTLAKNASTAAK
jgi:hypothetical protein